MSPSLIARLTQRRPRAQRQLEPADMGTGFGMEQWLDEADSLPAPMPELHQQRQRRHGAPRWLPRWLRRSVAH
ncbi:MAG: hypothetical protein CFE45_18150 [Burkholderiales bacterium PBB5]|nr:MAG: hypothetical protein CFE45_18150 [Burkholderiales bacterium PBB5]